MIDLRNHFKPGQVITGTTSIQKDFHIWVDHKDNYLVEAVYPYWLKARGKKGRRAIFTTGDLVISGVLDGFVCCTNPLARRL